MMMTHRMEDERYVMLNDVLRLDSSGRNVTDLPGLWSEDDKIVDSTTMNKIEGIPDGWELVRIGQGEIGDYRVDIDRTIMRCTSEWRNTNNVIVRKVEKPKTYRPFENAAEFEPHRDKWIYHPAKPCDKRKIIFYDDKGVRYINHDYLSYAEQFDNGWLFDDGIPFGVEVSE